jgi:hypothetical protein
MGEGLRDELEEKIEVMISSCYFEEKCAEVRVKVGYELFR